MQILKDRILPSHAAVTITSWINDFPYLLRITTAASQSELLNMGLHIHSWIHGLATVMITFNSKKGNALDLTKPTKKEPTQ